MLKFLALALAATIAANISNLAPTKSQQSSPPKTEAIGTERSQKDTNWPKQNSKPSLIIVEARVSGKLQTTLDQTNQKADAQQSKWSDPISIFTGLLVVVGFLQVWFLRNTDRATTKAAEAAKASADAVVSQLRASVHPSAEIVRRPDGGADIVVTIMNTGQTPAYDLRIVTTARTFAPNCPRNYEPEPAPANQSCVVLGPQFRAQHALHLQPFNNDTEIFVFGRIEYRDAFQNDRWTTFRFSASATDWPTENRMLVCNDGNDAT